MTQEGTPATYFFSSNERDIRRGPFSGLQLKQFAKQGVLKPSDLIWRDNSSKATEAARIKGLFREEAEQILTAELVEAEAPPVILNLPYTSIPSLMPIAAEVVSVKQESPFAAMGTTALLEDPMREISQRFGKFLWIMFIGLPTASLFVWVVYLLFHGSTFWAFTWGVFSFSLMLFGVYWTNLIWWRAFAPRRNTDVFYLRSFKNDQLSFPIRVAIQEALGDRVRLSGIRDPRRRSEVVNDGLSPWLKTMRHCTPKFMDLEAEDDWQERLWNSLQSGTMAVVDLSVVTTHVLHEVSLVTSAIGSDRTLFLGSAPQTESEIREVIAPLLGNETAAAARVMLWPANIFSLEQKTAVREFRQQFKIQFAEIATRPPIKKSPVPSAFVAKSPGTKHVPMSRRMIRWMFGFQFILLVVQLLINLLAKSISGNDGIQAAIIAIGAIPIGGTNLGLFFYNFYSYFRDVGILRRRIKAGIVLVLILIPLWFILIALFASQFFVGNETPGLSPSEAQSDAALIQAEDAAMNGNR